MRQTRARAIAEQDLALLREEEQDEEPQKEEEEVGFWGHVVPVVWMLLLALLASRAVPKNLCEISRIEQRGAMLCGGAVASHAPVYAHMYCPVLQCLH